MTELKFQFQENDAKVLIMFLFVKILFLKRKISIKFLISFNLRMICLNKKVKSYKIYVRE